MPIAMCFFGLHVLAQMTLNCIVGINVICLDNVKKHIKSFRLFRKYVHFLNKCRKRKSRGIWLA